MKKNFLIILAVGLLAGRGLICPGAALLPETGPRVIRAGDLVIEEYAIDISQTTTVFSTLPEKILQRREPWRRTAGKTGNELIREMKAARVARLNRGMGRSDYRFRLDGDRLLSLYRGGKRIAGDIPFHVTRKGCWGFSPAWARGELLRVNYLGRLNHLEIFGVTRGWDETTDELLKTEIKISTDCCSGTISPLIRGITGHRETVKGVQTFRMDIPDSPHLVYSFCEPVRAGAGPYIRLMAHRDQWVLLTEGKLIVNGRDLGGEKGTHSVEAFFLIDGRPLVFYSRPPDPGRRSHWPPIGTLHLTFDDRDTGVEYDRVCLGRLNEGHSASQLVRDQMICFVARRGDQWLYVEAGVYNPSVSRSAATAERSPPPGPEVRSR